MKKVLLLLIIIFCGCTSSDQDSSLEDKNEINNSISPPEWIRGTWVVGKSRYSGYAITSDEFSIISLCDTYSAIDEIENSITRYEEEITDTNYSILIIREYPERQSATTQSYEFEKISDTEIKNINNDITYIKQQNDWVNCNLFDENSVYPLNNQDAWFVLGVTKDHASVRAILEIYFEDGTIEKYETETDEFGQKNFRIDKDATKAVFQVKDLSTTSGILYNVSGELYNFDYSKQYFIIYEEDTRGVYETILFK